MYIYIYIFVHTLVPCSFTENKLGRLVEGLATLLPNCASHEFHVGHYPTRPMAPNAEHSSIFQRPRNIQGYAWTLYS